MSDVAKRYSDACTRSGLAALIAAGASLTVAERLRQAEPLEALGSYVYAREMLEIALEEISESDYRDAIANALGIEAIGDDTTVGQLAGVACVSGGPVLEARPRSTLTGKAQSTSSTYLTWSASASLNTAIAAAPKRPMPPQDIRVVSECPGIEELVDAMDRLSDDSKIMEARKVSFVTDFELYRWQRARDRIIARRRGSLQFSANTEHGVSSSANDLQRVRGYYSMTLKDLRDLSQHARTTMGEFEEAAGKRLVVSTPYVQGSQGPNSAGALLQIATLLFVLYFFLNAQAATSDGVTTDKGSIFALFFRSRIGAYSYLLLAVIPAAVSIYLAVQMVGLYKIIGMISSAATISLTGLLLATNWPPLRKRLAAARREPTSAG